MKKPAALKVLTAMDNKRDISVANRLKNILSNVNAGLENHQKTDYLFIYADTWSGENYLVIPSMKIKSNIIEKNTMLSPLKNFLILLYMKQICSK